MRQSPDAFHGGYDMLMFEKMGRMLLVTALLVSCRHKDAKTDDDGDGIMADVDCEDSSEAVGEASAWYADADGDGHGKDGDAVTSCIAPAGYVPDNLDCDDANRDVHPGATEDDCADPVDYNCDKSTGYDDADGDGSPACKDCDDDDSVTDPAGPTWYADLDGDGHGGTRVTAVDCSAPTGFVASQDDCDDLDATAFPGATETCDGVDDDCNGTADDNDPTGTTTFYEDADEDGYGNSELSEDACEAPAGFVANSNDCDDESEATSPAGIETCNLADDNCDGTVDEGATDGSTFYADVDGDGFGSIIFTTACEAPPSYVKDSGDCDDNHADFNPTAPEYCDGLDHDCDGAVDEPSSVDASTWYFDEDGDQFGGPLTKVACFQPEDHFASADDCNDDATNIYPGAPELCNGGIDDDCIISTPDNCTRASCKAWKAAGFNADGIYNIDPDGPGGAAAYNVTCEMDEDGGGWERCFTLTNTSAEDLIGNRWFDTCVTTAMATNHIGSEVRVALHDAGGASVYRGFGTRPSDWTFDNLTSTIDAVNQYESTHHVLSSPSGRIVSLDNGDKLMIAGRFSSNGGYGGSFGDGYGIVVYPPVPNYYFNPKMIVAGYRGGTSGQVRSFTGWSTDREITYQSPSFTTAPPGPMPVGTLGTFDFYVR